MKSSETPVYQTIADKHDVNRTTLSWKHKQIQADQETKNANQQKLTRQQKAELVKYIEELTSRHVPHTREIIADTASSIATEPVSKSWVTRFINNHSIHPISQYSAAMDANRHNADSYTKYELYFDLLQANIAQYNVDAEHTYTMDEKGFMSGVTTRTKHVFSRRMSEKKEVRASTQDGNRTWVTLIACTWGWNSTATRPPIQVNQQHHAVKLGRGNQARSPLCTCLPVTLRLDI